MAMTTYSELLHLGLDGELTLRYVIYLLQLQQVAGASAHDQVQDVYVRLVH